MNFFENPKLFIIDYYNDKRNQIDINCEQMILTIENKTKQVIQNEERQSLNGLRQNLIDKIDSAKEEVLKRYDTLQSKYTEEMLKQNIKQIKDEIFADQYCMIIEVDKLYPLLDLKLGLLLFSEFEDEMLKYFK